MKDQIARVYWHMGQALLPEHFYAQEESLRCEFDARFRFQSTVPYGLSNFKFNTMLLSEGSLSIEEMFLVYPTGHLVSVPHNAAVSQFNLNQTGQSRTSVYAHLLGDFKAKGEAGELQTIEHQIAISSQPYSDEALQSIKIAEFYKNVDGIWELYQGYIPPLLKISNSLFFEAFLERTHSMLESFQRNIISEIDVNYLGGESMFLAKQCLRGVYRMQAFLSDARSKVDFHPYDFFSRLKELYIDLCIYKNLDPKFLNLSYDHERIFETVGQILTELVTFQNKEKFQIPYLPFIKKDGVFSLEEMPEKLRSAKDIYLLVQKESVGSRLNLEGFKISALSRLQAVHQLALQGIPLNPIESPPFHHNFGSEVDFFKLSWGEEWDYVIKEGKVGFFPHPEVEKSRLFIYWREA